MFLHNKHKKKGRRKFISAVKIYNLSFKRKA